MDKCPYIKTIGNSEGSMDMCELTERPSGRIKMCVLMSGKTCEEWEDIKKEWLKEE